MSESKLQMVCVLPLSSKDEDWQMWSMKFHMHRMYKGSDTGFGNQFIFGYEVELSIQLENGNEVEYE